MPTSVLAGHSTYWQVFEGGPRNVLAIHCSLAHSGIWAGVADDLKDFATLVAFDLPMHGKSAPWDGARDLHDLSTDIATAQLDEPMDLIGHSFGATVALRLAARHPDRVRSLILIDPVLFAAAEYADRKVFDGQKAEAARLSHDMAHHGAEQATRGFVSVWGDGRKWDSLPPHVRKYMVDRIGFVLATEAATLHDSRGLLANGVLDPVTMPVLLVQGGETHPVVDAICAGLAGRVRNPHRVTIDGAGHMIPVTHAAQLAATIRAFLTGPI
jgi:lipase